MISYSGDGIMSRKGKVAAEKAHPEEGRQDAVCVHYWIIECPEGPESVGTCKNCGERKVFRNFAMYSPWEDDVTAVVEPGSSKKRNRNARPDGLDDSES
jgi:hypothetical protein